MPVHMRDSDCTIDLNYDTCIECGIYHGEPCPICGHRAYHAPYCPLKVSDCDKCRHFKHDCKSGDMYVPVIPIYTESSCQNFTI